MAMEKGREERKREKECELKNKTNKNLKKAWLCFLLFYFQSWPLSDRDAFGTHYLPFCNISGVKSFHCLPGVLYFEQRILTKEEGPKAEIISGASSVEPRNV